MATPILSDRRNGLCLIPPVNLHYKRPALEHAHPLPISVGRQPKIYVSSVTKRAEKPAFFALDRRDAVMSLCSFDGQYSWTHLTPFPFAFATSPILVLDAVLMMYGTDSPAAAAVEASSPSRLKMRWTPIGATAIGKGSVLPKTFVDRSGRQLVFTSRLGTIDHLASTSRFLRAVSPVPAFAHHIALGFCGHPLPRFRLP